MKKLTMLFSCLTHLDICVVLSILAFFFTSPLFTVTGQGDTLILGFGSSQNIGITSSSEIYSGQSQNTTSSSGFLPNHNAASRFLSHACLGYNFEEVELVTEIGFEDWIEHQINLPIPFLLADKVEEYHEFRKQGLNEPNASAAIRMYDYAWWQYHMSSNDLLRQRVAFALSEILVISKFSGFGNRPFAFASFYDILLKNAFGNYRDILQDVTYNPAMGVYLTYLNNPKTDTTRNQFPDENYARELMQLFTIGLNELNLDGTEILDDDQNVTPTYDNLDIIEFSKIFTGLTWGDQDRFGRGRIEEKSFTFDLQMFNDDHEPGSKTLLNGFVIPDRGVVDGDADISDALDNLFNHPNIAPFVCKLLIQRLVTSNPKPEYLERVSKVFIDNGAGVRGDMKAVIKAILLDSESLSCENIKEIGFGKMREPFIRYVHIAKAFDNHTLSGNHRNDMGRVLTYLDQTPNASPSVFNFFQQDYQPIGPIEENKLVAPEFQITNSQSLTGYFNGLDRWVLDENLTDEYDLYTDEDNSEYEDEISILNFEDEIVLATDNQLEILLDRLNMLLAHGNVSDDNLNLILEFLKQFPHEDEDDLKYRSKLAVYMIMVSPEYIINK